MPHLACHAGILVTSGSRFALVTCQWDGQDALGVDVGAHAQQGIAALRAVLGDDVCDQWIVSTPTEP